jgi:uncharacterized protein (DUF934 family)
MPLIKDNRLIDDPWVTVGDEAPLPDGAPAIISLARWHAEGAALRQRNLPLGIRLRSDQPPGLIAEDLAHFAVVALEFPKFTDGRAYSYARLLRERHGFSGELRAVGNVLRDQALFLLRCGFDAFEVAEGTTAEAWAKALAAISVRYQPASDGATPVYLQRRQDSRKGGKGKRKGAQSRDVPDKPRQAAPHAAPAGRAPAAEPCAGTWAY